LAEQNIIVDKKEGIGVITLNRPKVLNALSRDLTRELDDAVSDMEADAEVKVIIFTGSGERAFSAGADIHEMARIAEDPNPQLPDTGRGRYAWHIAACEKPTIGALNGLAYGGGAVMASTFDIRVGCERTSFKFLAASYGRVNSTWSLPMQVGWPVAKELLLTARTVEAEEAHRIGLLNHLVPSDQLLEKAVEAGAGIAKNRIQSVANIKQMLIEHTGQSIDDQYRNENEARQDRFQGLSVEEGFKDFLERKGRKPRAS